jgi:putative holliday junction resolvase
LHACPEGIDAVNLDPRYPTLYPPDAIGLFVDQMAPNARLMGLDAGTKTIGLALSDVQLSIATPLETIQRKKFSVDVQVLMARATALDVGGFVLGLPINLDGTEGPRVQATRAFARNLAAVDPRPILYWDERMTTMAAERALLEADTSRRKRAEVIDKVAAGLILQGALDRLAHMARASAEIADHR